MSDEQAARLHHLATEATALSQGVHLNELDAYQHLIAKCEKMTKAGFLGVQWSGEGLVIDRDDLIDSRVEGDRLQIGALRVTGEVAALHLLRLALLAREAAEIPVAELQNVLLPDEPSERARIADETSGIVAKLEQIKQRMSDISEAIDEIVASGLGLTPQEHEQIRARCQQFPLSVTVERPRYVWSPDRKRQARRIYQPGEHFK